MVIQKTGKKILRAKLKYGKKTSHIQAPRIDICGKNLDAAITVGSISVNNANKSLLFTLTIIVIGQLC